jgi:hypothetical protein
MSVTADPFEPWFYLALVLAALVFLLIELVFTLALSFSPGWANWGGHSIHWVFPAVMTICFAFLMVTLGFGLTGLIGLAMSVSRQNRRSRAVLLGWLVFWAALTIVSCAPVFLQLHAWMVESYPNGYTPGEP